MSTDILAIFRALCPGEPVEDIDIERNTEDAEDLADAEDTDIERNTEDVAEVTA